MSKRPRVTEKQGELLGDIHHQAAQIQHYSVLCFTSNRVGREWLLNMRHAMDRLELQFKKLDESMKEKEDGSKA